MLNNNNNNNDYNNFIFVPKLLRQAQALYLYPYQKQTMGMVWQSLGHTWPICGNGMGRPSDDMELMWGLNLAICMLWEVWKTKKNSSTKLI